MPTLIDDAVQPPHVAVGHRPRVGMVPHEAAYLAHSIDDDEIDLVEVPTPVDAACIDEVAGDIDALHLHQGLADVVPLGEPADLVAALEQHRIPLVLTLHQPPPAGVGTQGNVLDLLVTTADAVITLSPPAGGIVRTRWSVDPLVLPHPHVASLERIAEAQATPRLPGPWRVGLLPGRTPADAVAMEQAVEDAVAEAGVTVAVPAGDVRIDSPDTVEWVAHLDMLVLPPAWWGAGGWVELCRDLGTACVVPADAREIVMAAAASYPGTGASPEVVSRAIARGLSALPVAPAKVEERRAEAALVRGEHVALYRALLAAAPHLDEGRSHDRPNEPPW